MRIQTRRIGTVLAITAMVALGGAPAATAEQLPPNNTDWLLTANQAAGPPGRRFP